MNKWTFDPWLWGLIAADVVLLVIAAFCVWSAWHEDEDEFKPMDEWDAYHYLGADMPATDKTETD